MDSGPQSRSVGAAAWWRWGALVSLDEIINARKSLRAAITSYRHALIGASPALRARLLAMLEQLDRLESGETPMALYEARKGAA